MASIYLIRHGQASFGKADYDQLSSLGCEQSRVLGEYWLSLSAPTQFYCGDLLRHGQTLEQFKIGFNQNPQSGANRQSAKAVSTRIHSGLNEFDHLDVLGQYNPQWKSVEMVLSELANEQEASTKPKVHRHALLQQHLVKALQRWITGSNHHEYQESWPQFRRRCFRALEDIIQQSLAAKKQDRNEAESILVFTSAGTISAIIQQLLELDNDKALLMSQQIRNTSVSKLLFSDEKVSLDYFNNFSHLEFNQVDLVSHR